MAGSRKKAARSGPEGSGGIQSLDAALRLLSAMAAQKGPVALSEIARQCGMPLSKAHRYLASFHHAGLVVQAGRSGKYDLGTEAVAIGLSAIARYDFVNRASEELPELCTASGMTVLLAVWGNEGATVIRWQRSASPTIISMGLGTTLPLLNSATGRVFLAWAPPAPIQALLAAEMRRARINPRLIPDFTPTKKGLADLVGTVRANGYATVDGRFIPGLIAVSGPILDWQTQAQAAVTLVGTDAEVLSADSKPIRLLREFCDRLSTC